MYSASIELNAIDLCFPLNQEMMPDPTLKQQPELDRASCPINIVKLAILTPQKINGQD
jgi:hypothetical protein